MLQIRSSLQDSVLISNDSMLVSWIHSVLLHNTCSAKQKDQISGLLEYRDTMLWLGVKVGFKVGMVVRPDE
ncbi:hypothetical protein TR67_01110 [Pseudomonas deceptionensis]|nr:hypothetical protein TR67_01110 [Pseudomonas deceptionensis]